MKTGRILWSLLVLFAGLAFHSQPAHAQGKYYTNKDNVAINGYDLVAYFTQNEAVRGSQKHEAVHNGVKFWFASEEHKNMFLANPQKYEPQYGGWCAFGLAANNAKVPSDPKTFKLYNGKLYLFFNDFYQGNPVNTIVFWNADEANLKNKADRNWRALQKVSHK